MFEKEAEEYRYSNTNYYEYEDFCADDGEAIEQAYQKGATDGYNKKCEETFEMALLQIKHDREVVIGDNERLQKENAGLKARLNAINMLTPELEKSSKLKSQKLTYAKELLEEFMRIGTACDEDFEHDYTELIVKAEDFLKE